MPKALPAFPHIDWLKKAAKSRLVELRASDPAAKLHQAQLASREEYGFTSWRALKMQVDAASLDGRIISAAVEGHARELGRLLAEHPRKIAVTGGEWDRPLLHLAADRGHLGCRDAAAVAWMRRERARSARSRLRAALGGADRSSRGGRAAR